VDGLLVRTVTAAEKLKRRKAHAARRRCRGRRGVKNLKPLPHPRPGTDQTFKEVKFAVFYDQPKDHRHALATCGTGAEMGRLLRSHAGQVGIGQARQALGLTDGAAWIARQLDVNLPMLTARLLDFYHLASHVHEAARVCLGEGTPQAAAWAHARLHEAKHAGPTPVLAAVDALNRSTRSPLKREALRRLEHYVAERAESGMLDYPPPTRVGHRLGPHRGGGQEPGPARPRRGHEVGPPTRGGPDEPQSPLRERPGPRLLGQSRNGLPQLMGTPGAK
jgi:hypothetical protein